MKLLQLSVTIAMMASLCCTAQAYVLTFDDVPIGGDPDIVLYYFTTYGIDLEFPNLEVVDHTGSQWGPPHSGNNVLVTAEGFHNDRFTTMFKGQAVWSVFSFGAFFSTEQDVVLQMVGSSNGQPVTSAYIGAVGESWNNKYVEIGSPAGDISEVDFYPVSADAFHHFCLDDLTVIPVPEPTSLAALSLALLPIAGVIRRRRG